MDVNAGREAGVWGMWSECLIINVAINCLLHHCGRCSHEVQLIVPGCIVLLNIVTVPL